MILYAFLSDSTSSPPNNTATFTPTETYRPIVRVNSEDFICAIDKDQLFATVPRFCYTKLGPGRSCVCC